MMIIIIIIIIIVIVYSRINESDRDDGYRSKVDL